MVPTAQPAKVDIKSWEKRKWCRRNCFIEYIKNNPSPLIGFKHSEKFRKDCSRRMKGRYLGENHPNWKGGRHITRKGYVSIYNKCKRIFEHRLVMQTYLKRKLKPSELVHHKDGNKSNNLLNNLIIMSRSDHIKHHLRNGEINTRYWLGKKQPKWMIKKRFEARTYH